MSKLNNTLGVNLLYRKVLDQRVEFNLLTYELFLAFYARKQRITLVNSVLRRMARNRVVPSARILHYLMFMYSRQSRFARALTIMKQFMDLGVKPHVETLYTPLRNAINLYVRAQISMEAMRNLTTAVSLYADQLDEFTYARYVGVLTLANQEEAERCWDRRNENPERKLLLSGRQLGRMMLMFAQQGNETKMMEVLADIETRIQPNSYPHGLVTTSLATLYTRMHDVVSFRALEEKTIREARKPRFLHPMIKEAFMEFYANMVHDPEVLQRGIAFWEKIRQPIHPPNRKSRDESASEHYRDVRRTTEVSAITVLLAHGDFKSAIEILAMSLDRVPEVGTWCRWIDLCLKNEQFEWAFTLKDYSFGVKLPRETYEALMEAAKRRSNAQKIEILTDEMEMLGYITTSSGTSTEASTAASAETAAAAEPPVFAQQRASEAIV
jgi:tetratricopeptide (TPR) repeat protein